jgi:hypothetical protein
VVLDGLIVATSLFVVSWVFVLDKQLREDTGSRLSTLAQVFADVVLGRDRAVHGGVGAQPSS